VKENVHDVDLHILRLLQEDGRITNADLARSVGLSPPSVLQRVRKLEDHGLIQRYTTVLNSNRLGYQLMVFVMVSLALHRDQPIERFHRAISQIPEVLECHNVSGEFDFLIKVVAKDMRHYESFVREKLSRIDGIGKIQSCFVMSTTKQTTDIPI
jgi:Lrp/AsnC family leucine-responsive transcriptional regulator